MITPKRLEEVEGQLNPERIEVDIRFEKLKKSSRTPGVQRAFNYIVTAKAIVDVEKKRELSLGPVFYEKGKSLRDIVFERLHLSADGPLEGHYILNRGLKRNYLVCTDESEREECYGIFGIAESEEESRQRLKELAREKAQELSKRYGERVIWRRK
jgi:hypothetical protein